MKNQNEIFEKITSKVIEGLEEKGLKYFQPFKDKETGNFYPVNHQNIPYRGINQFILTDTAHQNNFINKWLTFKQVSDLKGNVNKGASSIEIYFYQKQYYVPKHPTKKYYVNKSDVPTPYLKDVVKLFILKTYRVFSISQTNLPLDTNSAPSPFDQIKDLEPIEIAEEIKDAWTNTVELIHSHKPEAYYSPSRDWIHMPNRNSMLWNHIGDYYKVYFHEAIHSTGHYSRLNRIKNNAKYGSDEYSKEELVAEIGAIFLSTLINLETEIDSDKNSQAYINNWISVLKSDVKFIFSAASKASESVNLILSKTTLHI
jgi:antirestriction protein ArdC